MSWIQKLYETSLAIDNLQLNSDDRPWPVSHVAKKAHVEVTIDSDGEKIRGVRTLGWDEAITIIPVTESSANRTNTDAPHPLCEELSYCAADLPGRKEKRYNSFIQLLNNWAIASAHPKVQAINAYLQKGTLYTDLSAKNIFPFKTVNPKGKKTPVEDKKVFRQVACGRTGESLFWHMGR